MNVMLVVSLLMATGNQGNYIKMDLDPGLCNQVADEVILAPNTVLVANNGVATSNDRVTQANIVANAIGGEVGTLVAKEVAAGATVVKVACKTQPPKPATDNYRAY